LKEGKEEEEEEKEEEVGFCRKGRDVVEEVGGI